MHNTRIIWHLVVLLMISFGCSRKAEFTGFHATVIQFSEYETQHIGLALLHDSSFYYVSRTREDQPWTMHTGQWRITGGKVFLKANDDFSLWLKPRKDQLEVLDYEGNEVVSDRPLRLGKPKEALWNQEIRVVMTGKLLSMENEFYFLPCNAVQFFRIAKETVSPYQSFDQVFTLRLSFVPANLHDSQETLFRLESVFGPAECH